MSIKNRDIMFLAKLALLAIITRFLFALSYHIVFIMSSKNPLYAPDGEMYSIAAWYIALVLKGVSFHPLSIVFLPSDYWVNSRLLIFVGQFAGLLPPVSSYGIGWFSYILGFFYYIFGYTPILFRLFNIIVSIATALLCYGLARDIFNRTVARVSFVLMLLLPSQFVYSASLLRDMIVNFLCILFIYSVLMLKQIGKPAANARNILYMSVSLGLIFLLRDRGVFPIVVSMLLYAAGLFYIRYKRIFLILASFLLVGTLAWGIPAGDFFKEKLSSAIYRHVAFASYKGYFYTLLPEHYYQFDMSHAFPQLPWRDIALACVNGIKSFLLEPFPFRGLRSSDILLLPEIIIWYSMVIFSLVGIARSIRRSDIRITGLLIFLMVYSFMIAMTGSNIEALIRHRGMIIPVYCIFAAYGYSSIGRNSLREGGHTASVEEV